MAEEVLKKTQLGCIKVVHGRHEAGRKIQKS
jgi:hypothetical protein